MSQATTCILTTCIKWLTFVFNKRCHFLDIYKAHFRFASSQCETSLQSNVVSHWLGANLESALYLCGTFTYFFRVASLTVWQSCDCPGGSKLIMTNMIEQAVFIRKKHKARTVCVFLRMYCKCHWARFTTLINFQPSMDNWLHPL